MHRAGARKPKTVSLIDDILGIGRYFTKKLKSLFFIFICLVLIVTLNYKNIISSMVNNASIAVISKFYNAVSIPITWITLTYENFNSYINIREKNAKLMAENLSLSQKLHSLQILSDENEHLKKILNVAEAQKQYFVTAKVISHNFNDAYGRKFIINAGYAEGIKEGQAVIGEQGLLGRIQEVYEHSSRVLSIADAASRIPAIFSRTGLRCILAGTNLYNNLLDLKYLEDEGAIEEDDVLLTSGDEGVLANGLYIGKAVYINNKLKIKTEIDWNKINYVIITSPEDITMNHKGKEQK